MQVWWCVALCACARAARPDAAYAEPGDKDLTPELLQQAIEMELEDAGSEQDPMLAGLRGAALCGGGGGCAGALWGRRWLLARASCAGALPLPRLAVLPDRDVASCGNITPESGAIGVLARFVHPQHAAGAGGAGGAGGGCGAHDAALLLLAAAAPGPPLDNHTRALLHVPELEHWLQAVPTALPGSWEPPGPARGPDAAPRLAGSPLRLLAAAVLLPLAALLLLFALALHLPAPADELRYDLMQHDALEHAPEPEHAPPGREDAEKTDSLTADRLAFL